MILTVERAQIGKLYHGLNQAGKRELYKELEDFSFGLRDVNNGEFVTMPDIEKHDISLEEMRSFFDATDREIAEALWYLSDRTVRVRKIDNYGTTALDYEDILPEDLAPMLILDASGQQRKTYEFWYKDRKGLQFLHSPQKSYQGLTIHHWDRGSGKKKHFKDVKTLAEGVTKTINNDIPKDDEVLVVHFKPTNKYDVEKEIRKSLEGDKDRVSFLNWGRHTATNKYAHIKHVILAGVLQYGNPHYETIGRAAKAMKKEDELSEEDYNGTRLGEIAHNIFQAACRGNVRKMENGGCPKGCHLYVIFSTVRGTGIPRALMTRTFPDSTIKDWKPIVELGGKYLKAGEIIARAGSGSTITKADLMRRLEIKDWSQLNRLLGNKDLKLWLAEQDIEIEAKGSRVKINVCLDQYDVPDFEPATEIVEWKLTA